MATKKRSDMTKALMDMGLGIGGGIIANQTTSFLEKQSFMAGKQQYAPLLTLGLGIAGFLYLPDQYKPLAFGMIVVSGTEQAEDLLTKATATTAPAPAPATTTATAPVQAIPRTVGNMQLGFTPQLLPDYAKAFRAPNGMPMR